MSTAKKVVKVKTSDEFVARLMTADVEAKKWEKSNAALAKTVRAGMYISAERDLKGQRVGTKNGETEMIVFPDKSAVLAAMVSEAFTNARAGKFLRP